MTKSYHISLKTALIFSDPIMSVILQSFIDSIKYEYKAHKGKT